MATKRKIRWEKFPMYETYLNCAYDTQINDKQRLYILDYIIEVSMMGRDIDDYDEDDMAIRFSINGMKKNISNSLATRVSGRKGGASKAENIEKEKRSLAQQPQLARKKADLISMFDFEDAKYNETLVDILANELIKRGKDTGDGNIKKCFAEFQVVARENKWTVSPKGIGNFFRESVSKGLIKYDKLDLEDDS